MRINPFTTHFSQIIMKDELVSYRPISSKFLRVLNDSPRQDLRIKTTTIQAQTFKLDEYTAHLTTLREQAILLAAAPTIRIGKNEDGSIWVDKGNVQTPEEALAKKREDGGEINISWKQVEVNLNWHGMARFNTLEQVGGSIDYYASEYAQYKTRILQTLPADEQAAELKKLDQLFATHVADEAAQFANIVGGFLENNGVVGEQNNIKNSFVEMFEQRITQYLDFIEHNDDYAGVKGTIDEWLLTAGDFMGEQLRYAYHMHSPDANLTSTSGYTIEDLTAIGTMVKEFRMIHDPTKYAGQSEEELGVGLGLVAMEYSLISRHFTISDNMKSKMDYAFRYYIDNQMNRITEFIEQQRQDPYVRNKEMYSADFDSTIVLGIINRMVRSLNSGNMNEAFKNDLSTIIALYTSKATIGKATLEVRYNPYDSSWTRDNYARDWNGFVRRLTENNGSVDKNRYLLDESISIIDVQI